MSRNSAYKLRKKPAAESFAAAWDAALGLPKRRVTIDDLEYLAYRGLVKPRFRGGRYVGFRQKPDNSALLKLVARYDRLLGGIERRVTDNVEKSRICESPRVTPARSD